MAAEQIEKGGLAGAIRPCKYGQNRVEVDRDVIKLTPVSNTEMGELIRQGGGSLGRLRRQCQFRMSL